MYPWKVLQRNQQWRKKYNCFISRRWHPLPEVIHFSGVQFIGVSGRLILHARLTCSHKLCLRDENNKQNILKEESSWYEFIPVLIAYLNKNWWILQIERFLPLYDGLHKASQIRFTISSKWIQENLQSETNKNCMKFWRINNIVNLNSYILAAYTLQARRYYWKSYHCFPEPRGPPANIMKIGIILAAETQRIECCNKSIGEIWRKKPHKMTICELHHTFMF